jgi:hypothetical protein
VLANVGEPEIAPPFKRMAPEEFVVIVIVSLSMLLLTSNTPPVKVAPTTGVTRDSRQSSRRQRLNDGRWVLERDIEASDWRKKEAARSSRRRHIPYIAAI